ncbi:MAG: glycine cleavage system aminomethyltransferase GcvT [Tissierella sp.]|nr:glycine cleavage system aminomethyltransferase GcvT [Tissierella sp.]
MDGKKTPLYEEHNLLKGKIVNYAGWLLPVQYEGLVPEHNAVRNAAGIFDVSHMGSIFISGKDSKNFLDHLMTNDISKLNQNQIVYTFMCYPDGGVVDDLLVYKYEDERYFLVVNAANLDKDFQWLLDNKGDYEVEFDNISQDTCILALQGPLAEKILQMITDIDLSLLKFFHFNEKVKVDGIEAMISRTGYTGEDGFEIFVKNDDVVRIWKKLLEVGSEFGLKPTGLGCRDTLRFEAALPLYGNELSKEINPLEAGFKFFVKLKKESDFIGRESLVKQWENGLERKLVGFEMIDRGIPREGYEIYKGDTKIGHVTTGYMSPTLNKNIGNGLILIEESELDSEIEILIRNRKAKAKVINKNFLKDR